MLLIAIKLPFTIKFFRKLISVISKVIFICEKELHELVSWTYKSCLIKKLIVSLIAGQLAAKIARKESLSLKLALRPDRQELINRNILQLQTDNERQETKEAIGAKLIRWASVPHFFFPLPIFYYKQGTNW